MEPKKEGEAPEGEAAVVIDPAEFGKLQTQVENLNKGIATYRDSANDYKSKYESLHKEVEDLKKAKAPKEEKVALDPEDEKRLEAWAKSKGFVSKEEMDKERQNLQRDNIKQAETQAVQTFLEKFPEYDDDGKWTQIMSEFQLYRTPTTTDGYLKLLNKIKSGLEGDTGKARKDGEAKAKADMAAKSRLSLGGRSQQKSSQDDATVESLQEKYPNLSRDQIEAKLAEINDLYPEDKK